MRGSVFALLNTGGFASHRRHGNDDEDYSGRAKPLSATRRDGRDKPYSSSVMLLSVNRKIQGRRLPRERCLYIASRALQPPLAFLRQERQGFIVSEHFPSHPDDHLADCFEKPRSVGLGHGSMVRERP
jgi:hypothetical protein